VRSEVSLSNNNTGSFSDTDKKTLQARWKLLFLSGFLFCIFIYGLERYKFHFDSKPKFKDSFQKKYHGTLKPLKPQNILFPFVCLWRMLLILFILHGTTMESVRHSKYYARERVSK
jgi:hypothetical protein